MQKNINCILCLLSILIITKEALAQTENDLLRYSTTGTYGSARFEAMAGSFGALGADFSSIQINPAGLGRFSSSKVAVSINNSFLQNDALYNKTRAHSNDYKFALSEIGAVITTDISRNNNGRRYNQFSFGYTRLKNFTNTQVYEGQNFYSLLDVFANAGYGIDPGFIYDYNGGRPFTTGLAYDTYAIDYDPSSQAYYSRLTAGDMYHHRKISTAGGIGEFHFAYSENYRNKLYYGGSIGIRRYKYGKEYIHNERLLDTVGTTLRSFEYTHNEETKGTGWNVKLGVIYLPSQQFRVGLSFESATMAKLQSTWTANMRAIHNFGMLTVDPSIAPKTIYTYRIKTPMKLRGSFAYIFGMRGAINIDLEWVNLPAAKLKPSREAISTGNAYQFDIENEAMNTKFRSLFNTRIGIEYMVISNLYLRGGIAILPQPYQKDMGRINTPNITYALGVGWENRFLSINISYRLLHRHYDYYAFDPSKIENRTRFNSKIHDVGLTVAYRW